MLGCNCNAGLSNTGRPNCVPVFGVTSSMILVPLYDNDGNRNSLDLTVDFPDLSTLINEIDKSKRWFPLPQFENIELPKADSQFEEANSGRMVRLRQGKRSFTGELWAEDSTPTFLGKLNDQRCVDFGIYIVDVQGNLIGSKEGDKLYPISVDNQSFDPKFAFATDSTTQKIMVAFDIDRLFDESSMYMISASEVADVTATNNLLNLKGLIDVNLNVSDWSDTAIVLSATFDYGTAKNPLKYKGADQSADWKITNTDTDADIPVTSVTELPDGTYTLAFATVGAGVNVKVETQKDGFEGSVSGQTV